MAEEYLTALGLSQGATIQQIKKQFRKLALKFHPDRNIKTASTERFIEISQAYEKLCILMNEEKEQKYIDEVRKQYLNRQKKKQRHLWQQAQREQQRKREIKTHALKREEERQKLRDETRKDIICYRPWKKSTKQNVISETAKSKRVKDKQRAKIVFKKYIH